MHAVFKVDIGILEELSRLAVRLLGCRPFEEYRA